MQNRLNRCSQELRLLALLPGAGRRCFFGWRFLSRCFLSDRGSRLGSPSHCASLRFHGDGCGRRRSSTRGRFGPEVQHAADPTRGGRLGLALGGCCGLATRPAHHRIRARQPHTHERVFLGPGIFHAVDGSGLRFVRLNGCLPALRARLAHDLTPFEAFARVVSLEVCWGRADWLSTHAAILLHQLRRFQSSCSRCV